jgi:hypothetical protein
VLFAPATGNYTICAADELVASEKEKDVDNLK